MSSQTAAPPVSLAATRVAFVGAGPGDPGLLTVRARTYLAEADVVVHDDGHDPAELDCALRDDVQLLPVGRSATGKQLTHRARVDQLVRLAQRVVGPRGLVVRLMTGDPTAFSTLAEEALACRRAGLPIEIVPGVSTAWSVPAYAGVPLSGDGTEVHLIDTAREGIDFAASVADDVEVVLLGTAGRLTGALEALASAGRAPTTPVCMVERGTTVRQHSVVTTLAEATADLLGQARAGTVFDDGAGIVAVVGGTVPLRHELSWYETKPMFGWQVLVPRTKDQAGTMTDRVRTYGATPHVVPTIRVERPRTPQQMDRAIRGLVTGRYEWIGFTSVNAVRAVREKFVDLGLDARAFAGLRIAAVGGVTAEALRAWGLEPDLLPEGEESAKGLLEVWPPYDDVLDPIQRVLLPRADIATDTLVAGLQKLGWEVDDVTAYRTVRAAPPAPEVREAIKTGQFDAVCFTSSSTVRNLIGIAGKPHPETVIACIGPATARTAEEHGLRVDVVAGEACSVALVDALAGHAASMATAALASGDPVLRPSERRLLGRRGRSRR